MSDKPKSYTAVIKISGIVHLVVPNTDKDKLIATLNEIQKMSLQVGHAQAEIVEETFDIVEVK